LLHLDWNGLGEGGGRALAETLRLNTTLTSLNLRGNGLREGGGQALAETLRLLNKTVTSLNLRSNGLGEGGGRALAEALRLNTTVTSLEWPERGRKAGAGRDTAPQHQRYVAQPSDTAR